MNSQEISMTRSLETSFYSYSLEINRAKYWYNKNLTNLILREFNKNTIKQTKKQNNGEIMEDKSNIRWIAEVKDDKRKLKRV